MITKIKNICKRLKLAYQIARGYKCYYLGFSQQDTPEYHVYYAATMDAAWEYLSMMTDNYESFDARLDIVKRALEVNSSILTQYKKGNDCYVSYDCNSEEDLDEFLNQEI